MKPRRTHRSTGVYHMPGATEDSDLWVEQALTAEGTPLICSTWEPTEEERQAIAAGANIELVVWGTGTPPVDLGLTTVPLGAPPRAPRGS